MTIIDYLQKYRLELVSFFVGGTILAFELTAARVVAPYIGTTIYTWTSVIGVILAALAAGYAVGGKVADQRKASQDVVWLLAGAAAALLLVNLTKDWLLGNVAEMSISLRWQALLASVLLFSFPTFLMGMISPYLARLSITKLSSSGASLARISAAGTVGSLAGTFVTGFLLFSVVGSRYILTWLSIFMVLTSFLLALRFALATRTLLLLMGLLMLLYSPHATIASASVLEDLDTAYSRVIVNDRMYENRPIRVLQTDDSAWQSGVYLDGSKELVFGYTRAFAEVLKTRPNASNVLVIGGGSYSFPEFIASAYPTTKIDVIEIDTKLTDIAIEYFNFKQPQNLHIINQDGRQFLNNNRQKYDMIFMDAFSSMVPPFQLMSQQAVERLSSSLTPDGLVILNAISAASGGKSKISGSIAATYESVFKEVAFYQVDANFPKTISQNLLLVASKEPFSPGLDKALTSSGAGAFHTKDTPASFAYTKVLTDDFAPVEILTAESNL